MYMIVFEMFNIMSYLCVRNSKWIIWCVTQAKPEENDQLDFRTEKFLTALFLIQFFKNHFLCILLLVKHFLWSKVCSLWPNSQQDYLKLWQFEKWGPTDIKYILFSIYAEEWRIITNCKKFRHIQFSNENASVFTSPFSC